MARKIFKRFLPDAQQIKNNRLLRFLGNSIHDSDLWHLNKHSVAGAFFIGVFCSLQPIPFQMVLAALLAAVFKRNLPLSVALVFITNPLTMGPVYYFNYRVGSLFLGAPSSRSELEIHDLWTWLSVHFHDIGAPLFFGSLITGTIFALISYFGIHLFWIWHVTDRWRKRLRKRRESKIGKT